MRKTTASTRRHVSKVTKHVKTRLAKSPGNNIAVYLPRTTDKELALLRQNFQTVERGAFGYVEFTVDQCGWDG